MTANLKQGTEEWLEFRKNKIGASEAPIIMGDSPYTSPYTLWEEKVGLRQARKQTNAMKRGIELEEQARQKFTQLTKIHVSPEVLIHPDYEWMIASLDGIDEERKNIVEIKCPMGKDHEEARRKKVPAKYFGQLQHQMAVCNLAMAYYFSYDGEDGVLLEVERDNEYISKLIDEEEKFITCVREFVAPDLIDRDFHIRSDETWNIYAERYLSVDRQLDRLTREKEELRDHLLSMSSGFNTIGGGVKLTKVVRKGLIDYKSVPGLADIDLDKYRKGPTTTWRISTCNTNI